MTLSIQSSNRVENLQQNLTHVLAKQPLSNPMEQEIIVVPGYAMARWLNLRIAQQQGIAANISYCLPASWLWDMARRVITGLPEQDPLRLEAMVWKLFSILPTLLPRPEFTSLRKYLVDDQDSIKCWQLCSRIAEVFDRYQQYRPQLIRDWSSRADNQWQCLLWRALISDLKGGHRVDILSRLIDRLQQMDVTDKLPERISLFSLSSLPALTIDVIHALARQTSITLYQHSPTDHYFADLKSIRSLLRLQRLDPQKAASYDIGHELLASWGRQGQVMQARLLAQDIAYDDVEFNHPPGNARLLASIQQSIFDLDSSFINRQIDDSVVIHVCHSAMRECQVLHDQLLNILSEYPALSPEDILVMVPEISRYAPYIEAVFGFEGNADRPWLPWNLSDISISDEHPLVQSLLQLLALPASRFEYTEVMSLLEIAEIQKRFDIDQSTLADIQQWIDIAQVRWGIDAEFKLSLGLPATIENTWQQAQQRLFAGYALGDVGYWNGIAPLPQIDSGQAANIAKFCQLFERLQYWRLQLGQPAANLAWISRLNLLIDDFYENPDLSENRMQDIRNSIDALKLAENCQLSTPLLRAWLQKQLAMQHRPGRLYSGGVTFCGMRPMRNLPFQVICLLGMNDQAFPRRRQRCDFDLMQQYPQTGDPGSADEDRYLMLETLLGARHTLYISYVGRSLKDNSECQPSVLVQELLDFIDAQWVDVPDDGKPSRQLTRFHPMQPFSADNFSAPLLSFNSAWCAISRQLNQKQAIVEKNQWPQKTQPARKIIGSELDLEKLHRFLRHPIQYFFNTRFNLYLHEADDRINDERFLLDLLSIWQIKTRLADDWLKGQRSQQTRLSAEGLLPHGSAAQIELNNIRLQQQHWLEQLSPFSGVQRESRPVNLKLDDALSLCGEVVHYYPSFGLMHYSASRLQGKHLLALWLDHLCLCASHWLADSDSSQLIAADQVVRLQKVGAEQAIDDLREYVRLFRQGQNHLLPVFANSSFVFCQATDPDKAIRQAQKVWQSSSSDWLKSKNDADDPYIQLALRNAMQDPLNHPAFIEYARRFYQNLLQHRIT